MEWASMSVGGEPLTSPTLVHAVHHQLAVAPAGVPLRYLADGEDAETAISYAELDARARLVAAAIRARQPRPGPVLLLTPPGPEFVVGFLGICYAGGMVVPCYPPNPRRFESTLDRMRMIVVETEAALGLTVAEALPLVESLGQAAPELAQLGWLPTDGADLARLAPAEPAPVEPADVAFLQYTSGSTTAPRGVVVTHANLMANLRAIQEGAGLTPEDHSVFWLPPYHDMGLVTMLHALATGCCYVALSPVHFLQRPARWLRALSRYRATFTGAPNFALELCVDKVPPAERAGLDLSGLGILFCGAEPVRADTVERFVAAYAPVGMRTESVVPVYGLAEGTLFITGRSAGAGPAAEQLSRADLHAQRVVPVPPGADAVTVVSCGYPRSGQRVAIVDPDRRVRLPDGEIGEIWVAGPSVAAGYWRRPDDTARVFGARLRDPADDADWLRTGDLGYLRAGELFVTGRRKDLVVVRGRNHYPHDVERTAELADPAVKRGCVAAFGHEAGGAERLVVVAEVDGAANGTADDGDIGGGAIDTDRVVAAIRTMVARVHGIEPYAVVLVPPRAVPKTSSGKVQRAACRVAYETDRLPAVASWRASDQPERLPELGPAGAGATAAAAEITRRLTGWLAAALGRPEGDVDPDRALAELGLDSARLVELTGSLAAWVGRPLPPTAAWDFPTVRTLAEHVAGRPEPTVVGPTIRLDDVDPDRVREVLAEIEAMSEAEVRAELATSESRES